MGGPGSGRRKGGASKKGRKVGSSNTLSKGAKNRKSFYEAGRADRIAKIKKNQK